MINKRILKPDMRIKIEEYIAELDRLIKKFTTMIEEDMSNTLEVAFMEIRISTLTDVRNDLQGRLDEVI